MSPNFGMGLAVSKNEKDSHFVSEIGYPLSPSSWSQLAFQG